MTTWTPATVAIDDFLGPFPAEIADTRWNGWVCPRFTRETAQALIAQNNAFLDRSGDTESDRLAWDGDTVLVHSPSYADEPGYEDERITPDADGRYAIGAWSWTWTTA